MGIYEDNYLSKRPQELCKMCGRCCRVVTTTKSYEELLALQEQNDKGACEFLRIFVPYPSIEAARVVDRELVDNVINLLKEDGNYHENKMTFYYCKYLLDNNLCSIYEERPLLCRHCPAHCFRALFLWRRYPRAIPHWAIRRYYLPVLLSL